MKIGLIGNETSKSAIEVDVRLPDEVKFAHDAIRRLWDGKPASNIGAVPWMVYNNQQSHGPDSPGLIYHANRDIRFPNVPGFNYSDSSENVGVRISVGMDRPYEQKKEPLIVSPEDFNRMHFGISATRGFFPGDYLESKSNDDKTCINTDRETVLVSLRWLARDGNFKFDDWNREGIRFNWDRATYATYRQGRGGFSMGIGQEGEKNIQKYLEGIPRRERLLQVTADERIRGYEPVLDFLSRFGDVSAGDAERIPGMNPKQGIEYLMKNVLPAMDRFVKA